MEKIKYLCKTLHPPFTKGRLSLDKRKWEAEEGDAGTEKKPYLSEEEGLVWGRGRRRCAVRLWSLPPSSCPQRHGRTFDLGRAVRPQGAGEAGNRTVRALKLPGCDGREAQERHPGLSAALH